VFESEELSLVKSKIPIIAPMRIIPTIIHIHHFVRIDFFGSSGGNGDVEGLEGRLGFMGVGFVGKGLETAGLVC